MQMGRTREKSLTIEGGIQGAGSDRGGRGAGLLEVCQVLVQGRGSASEDSGIEADDGGRVVYRDVQGWRLCNRCAGKIGFVES